MTKKSHVVEILMVFCAAGAVAYGFDPKQPVFDVAELVEYQEQAKHCSLSEQVLGYEAPAPSPSPLTLAALPPRPAISLQVQANVVAFGKRIADLFDTGS